MNNIYNKINKKPQIIDTDSVFNEVLRDASYLNSLPDEFKKSPEILSRLLSIFPYLFATASKTYLEKDQELLKQIITAPIPSLENRPFETLSLAHEKIKTRDFCLDMVAINPYNIRHVPNKFLYDSDFIEMAINGDGATVQFLPLFVKQNENFGLMAVKNNGFALQYFSPSVINTREVLLTALDTKGFSLSLFDNPELMCHDSEIAEKALKADPKAIQFFHKDNPLLKDKYFAIKMIPYNAKFFALFDQEIRHDPDTLLQIVKGKSVETILYIVSQEFTLYPKFFLFALDAYQKCLTDDDKQDNFGFYYYLHTALFKERQKKFNIAYRRNLERQKIIAQQEEQKEIERRKIAQEHILINKDSFELGITENNNIPSSLLHREATGKINVQLDNTSSSASHIKDKAVNSSFKLPTNEDNIVHQTSTVSQPQKTMVEHNTDDDFSHLANLADDLNSNEPNDVNPNISENNLNSSNINVIGAVDSVNDGFIDLSQNDEEPSIASSSFVDFQSYTSPKVKKANEDLNDIKFPSLEVPKNKAIVPDVTRYQEPTPESIVLEERIEPDFDDNDMSPAQNAARRAFGNRTRTSIAPDIQDENDYIHKPTKRETTKKGSMSIFNFKKD